MVYAHHCTIQLRRVILILILVLELVERTLFGFLENELQKWVNLHLNWYRSFMRMLKVSPTTKAWLRWEDSLTEVWIFHGTPSSVVVFTRFHCCNSWRETFSLLVLINLAHRRQYHEKECNKRTCSPRFEDN